MPIEIFDVRALGAGKAPSKGPMGWVWGALPAMLDFFLHEFELYMIITTIYQITIIYYVI